MGKTDRDVSHPRDLRESWIHAMCYINATEGCPVRLHMCPDPHKPYDAPGRKK